MDGGLEKEAQKIGQNSTLLMGQFNLVVIKAIRSSMLILIFILIPILASALNDHPEFSVATINLPSGFGFNRGILLYWISLPIGLFAIKNLLSFKSALHLCFRAKAVYMSS